MIYTMYHMRGWKKISSKKQYDITFATKLLITLFYVLSIILMQILCCIFMIQTLPDFLRVANLMSEI